MSSNHSTTDLQEELRLGPLGGRLRLFGFALGVLGLGVGTWLGAAQNDHFQHFQFSFLTAFWWGLTIALGGLYFVTLQHLTRAVWSHVLRRVAELVASTIPLFAVLALVVIVPMWMGNHGLFPWTDHEVLAENHFIEHKASYLNVPFFTARCVFYFVVWFLFSRLFLKRSVKQDETGVAALTEGLWAPSAIGMIAFAITITFAAIDFLMSLEPAWFSTIFGLYIFSGAVQAFYSFLALAILWLQMKGRLTASITVHHRHDVGKMMFAFVVFWAYIAFSQFMLIWYGNIPEETFWYWERAAQNGKPTVWMPMAWSLVFCNFIIPFIGLLSRHVKRSRFGLAFWAMWLLVMHYVDLYWVVMPAFSKTEVPFGLMDIALVLGVFGLFLGVIGVHAAKVNLRPTRDPRLAESLAFENM